MTSWAEIRAGWSASWQALAAGAMSAWTAAVRADPTGAASTVRTFAEALEQSRAALERMAPKLPRPPRDADDRRLITTWEALATRYRELAAGLYAEAAPVEGSSAQIGAPPAVLVIGGLAIGVVGAAWALAAWQYAVNLREQTALAERELDARIAAARSGRPLPPSTLPQPSSPEGTARQIGALVLGGFALLAGALTLPALLKR